jgi:hypothetical protein
VARVINNMLCFVWQDNNTVLGLTTAYSLYRPEEDIIIRNRKRLKETLTNGRITRPIFGNLPRKELAIPKIIDDYNHYINDVDLANQLRAWMTCSRPGIYKAWHPLWYWLLDTCACNAYLIWKGSHKELDLGSSRLHRRFQECLIQALFNVPDERPIAEAFPIASCLPPGHWMSRFPTRQYCQWCKAHPEERLLKGSPRRPVLGEVINGVRPGGPIPPSQTINGCGRCGVHLCLKGPCFDRWHSQNRSH